MGEPPNEISIDLIITTISRTTKLLILSFLTVMTSNLLKYKAADLIHLIEWSYQTRMAEKVPTGVNRYMKIVIQQVA